MQGYPEVAVLRYGHRPGRDDRMTTHVGLTARALGADRVLFPDNATQSAETVRDITGRFGGPFDVELTEELNATIEGWEGVVVHLTMYGERVQDVEADVRDAHVDQPVLVVVGGEKVPGDVYEHADWNLAVTNQPHSEVAGLAVFLDRLFDGRELEQEYEDAERRVVPEELGKHVVDVRESRSDSRSPSEAQSASEDVDEE
ncbi:tRNA (cytidine(56)-2'-O)-methyltransferase [Halobacterium hubeiense]|uniref:tRNA (cytidine(56)-2'-O)-methyltransferase n=1 Tax=Halobacterium hubeiense TaxID=1407499 RepID=A0A0U5GZ09_9EURY|nr:tRNA (cytidine(56)-2'-O)-methyltransferase [Halobacterium hubeiense]CQH52681.1 tRNA (cytidine(56)-2'-O)-methyltransferase [Halobacterium hubeiense]